MNRSRPAAKANHEARRRSYDEETQDEQSIKLLAPDPLHCFAVERNSKENRHETYTDLDPLLLIFLCSRVADAQAIPVSGRVLRSGGNAPVAQAIVDFAGPERARAVTIGDGTFYISKLATGTYTVTLTFKGKIKKSFSISVPARSSFTFYIDP